MEPTRPVRWETSTFDPQFVSYDEYMHILSPRQSKAARVKEQKARDLAFLDQLANRGTSDFLMLKGGKQLVVLRPRGTDILFTVSKIIKVDKSQKHLHKPLAALAEREGLGFQLVETFHVGPNLETVDYWPWKVRQEVDDSDLMVTVPEPPTMPSFYGEQGEIHIPRIEWDMTEPVPF